MKGNKEEEGTVAVSVKRQNYLALIPWGFRIGCAVIPTTHYSTHISIQKSIIFKLWREHHHHATQLPRKAVASSSFTDWQFFSSIRSSHLPGFGSHLHVDEGANGTILTFSGIFITICHFHGKLLFFKITTTTAKAFSHLRYPPRPRKSLLKRIVFRCKFLGCLEPKRFSIP